MNRPLIAIIIAVASFVSTDTAQANLLKKLRINCEGCCDCQNAVTVETCRRYFSKSKRILGCPKTFRFVEITYETTNGRGKTKIWKKIYRS